MTAKRGYEFHRKHGVTLDDVATRRVRDVVARLGVVGARKALGLSEPTLDNARFGGQMQPGTVRRILETLERVDA
jgi:hypothetical protein